jgi:fatty acid desaturase
MISEKPAIALECPPSEWLNIGLAIAIITTGLFLQWLASHVLSLSYILAIGVIFSFLFLPLYSLLHEAEHYVFHRHQSVNDAFGFLLGAFFPGSFTFLRFCHLGHHKRNRTDAEMFDLYYPTDNLLRKRIYFYALYLGAFWFTVPVATLVLIVYPSLLQTQLLQDTPSTSAMINGVAKYYLRRIRLESLAVLLIQGLVFWALDLQLQPYLLLYALFGLNWSSQQYINHADSPRHILNGAHNLKAHPLYSALLLNFNWHLAHHQHPNVPWIHLPKFDDTTRTRPGYIYAFIRFWRGPQPFEET